MNREMRSRRWIWVILFIFAVLLIGTMATGWNIVLVRDSNRLSELAKRFSLPLAQNDSFPIYSIVLGSLGFLGILGGMILFFVRLLQEMKLNQQQSEFLATVSHELKTPLSTLELSASLLEEGEDLSIEERKQLWESHRLELRRLSEDVHALLEAAKWQSKAVNFRKSPIHLENWLETSLNRWKGILGYEGSLTREGEALDCEVLIDERTLNTVTDNLLDNARKFSQPHPHVTVRTEVDSKHWQIQITDNGRGFNPDEAENIFKRFYRTRGKSTETIPGTGLGLYLAASASQALGLDLEGQSEGTGHGATFTLRGKRK